MKTTFAAIAIATAMAAPVSTANAGGFGFSFGPHGFAIHGGHGHGYGHGHHPKPSYGMSCWEARHYLKGHFGWVKTVECKGKIYTFKVKKWGHVKYVKLNRYNGKYWFA